MKNWDHGKGESGEVVWVAEDVAYIIASDERNAFNRLQSDAEREHLIEQFWQRRDPTPDTAVNEFKEEHYRRIAYSNNNFGTVKVSGWKTDRGRIYITYGPPDEKETHPSGVSYQRSPLEGDGTTSTFPFEQWRSRFIEGMGIDIVIEFIDPTGKGEYHMSGDPIEKDSLLYVLPVDPALTKASTPKAGATVQMMAQGTVLISIPLAAYGNHRVNVSGRVVTKALHYTGPMAPPNPIQVFEDSIQGPAPLYTKVMPVAKGGTYQFEIVVKDMTTGKFAADTIEFEGK